MRPSTPVIASRWTSTVPVAVATTSPAAGSTSSITGLAGETAGAQAWVRLDPTPIEDRVLTRVQFLDRTSGWIDGDHGWIAGAGIMGIGPALVCTEDGGWPAA